MVVVGLAVFSAVVGAALSKGADYGMRRLMQAADEEVATCKYLESSHEITAGEELFSIPYEENFRVSFYVTMSGERSGNILQVGAQDGDEFPAVMFRGLEPFHDLEFQFHKEGAAQTDEQIERFPVALNQAYHVRIEFQGLNAQIIVDNQQIADVSIPASVQPANGDSLPVFAGNAFNDAAQGRIHGLSVCSSAEWLPAPPESCQAVRGNVPLATGKKLFDVDIGANLDLSLVVTVDGEASGHDIVRIGNVGGSWDQDAPLLWFRDGELKIHFQAPGGPDVSSVVLPEVVLGEPYFVQIRRRGADCTVRVDGAVAVEFEIGANNLFAGAGHVFTTGGTPFNGRVEDLRVCTYE